ncbi:MULTISPECIES: hypothetical protein [Sinorhizobium]|uniref:hypothetical protein n=1 Tax=Sinorhizobium TaxID=28105 RepID=UPI000BE8032A|nr:MULTISPECIES: hypothetical protein [Sinorhizobium]PDT50047.1 hypothetical protein CO664_26385 [Sinorhizobium sp. NG07B]POH33694.1 hypothetical protein ATY30_01540 [Sinorhizobium americanum]
MWKTRIRNALPVAAFAFSWWVTDSALNRLQERYNLACAALEEHRILYSCANSYDYELLVYTCIAASLLVGYIVWWVRCRPHQERA